MKRIFALFALLGLLTGSLRAQPPQQYIRVQVSPDHSDWAYRTGEKVKFDIRVMKNDIPLENVKTSWEIAEDMMPPLRSDTQTLPGGTLSLDGGTLRKPGFLRCVVRAEYNGRTYEGLATAAFEPEKITATQVNPDDFDRFWEEALAANAALPIDPVVTLLPERCTGTVDVYHVSLQNYRPGARVYGILCVPKAAGKHPAVLSVPGAGIRPYNGDITGAENGLITFEIGIHGIPVTMPPSYYRDLERSPLEDYPRIKLDDRDNYYYKRVYLGCIRAVDFLYTLPGFDGQNLCVQGGSQGGALSIVTASLDPRVTCLVAYFPALCDLTGYLHGRAGGWPHLFRDPNEGQTRERIHTTAYYDVVNFARRLRKPGFYTLGYNDRVCPPTSMFSAYNAIPAEKELFVCEDTGHFSYPEQWVKAWEWMNARLGR